MFKHNKSLQLKLAIKMHTWGRPGTSQHIVAELITTHAMWMFLFVGGSQLVLKQII